MAIKGLSLFDLTARGSEQALAGHTRLRSVNTPDVLSWVVKGRRSGTNSRAAARGRL
jgi:hypothetical protein